MRKVSNVITGLIALGVCAFITTLSMDSDLFTIIYNLAFLAVMLLIIAASYFGGFMRLSGTTKGLNRASEKLSTLYKNKSSAVNLLEPGTELFEVGYLDKKYQEYVAYIRKTNTPCDIGDYIGEYEINNYTHRRLLEMVPDILTSLGILGTFIGLVWGLKGFNPGTYETMTTSVSSLVDGIKVAFITSIYGISLSLVFSYWLKGSISGVSESLDSFLDKYYVCAVPPTDSSAMNHVLSNQKEQTKVMQGLTNELTGAMSSAFENQIVPAVGNINDTLDHFTSVVTMNQDKILQNVAHQVMETMKTEFLEEFSEMRVLLKDSNKAQREYMSAMAEANNKFQNDFMAAEREMSRALKTSGTSQTEMLEAMQIQQEHLREFVDYMAQVMDQLGKLSTNTALAMDAVSEQMERISPRRDSEEMERLLDRLDHLTILLEKQNKQTKKKGLFS